MDGKGWSPPQLPHCRGAHWGCCLRKACRSFLPVKPRAIGRCWLAATGS